MNKKSMSEKFTDWFLQDEKEKRLKKFNELWDDELHKLEINSSLYGNKLKELEARVKELEETLDTISGLCEHER